MKSPETSGYARLAEAEESIRTQAEQEAAREAAVTEAYNDEAMRDEANTMNSSYDKDRDAKQQQYEDEMKEFHAAVEALNDKAHLEIYGTEGRTRGYKDPETGEPLATPIKGLIDVMREDPKYGKTQADRDAAAGKYEKKLLKLVDKGFELSQAKVVMDLRAERSEELDEKRRLHNTASGEAFKEYTHKLALLTNQYVKNGHKRTDAIDLATQRLGEPKGVSDYKESPDHKKNEKKRDKELRKRILADDIYRLEDARELAKHVDAPKGAPKGPEKLDKVEGIDLLAYKEVKGERGLSFKSYGIKFSKPGDVIKWGTIETTDDAPRMAIITKPDGTELFIQGNRKYDLSKARAGENPLIEELISDGDEFTDTEIGADCTSVEVAISDLKKYEKHLDEFADTDTDDPFKAAKELISKYKENNEGRLNNIRNRVKNAWKTAREKIKENREGRLIDAKKDVVAGAAGASVVAEALVSNTDIENITLQEGQMNDNIKDYLRSNGYAVNKKNLSKMWDAVEAGIADTPEEDFEDLAKIEDLPLPISSDVRDELRKDRLTKFRKRNEAKKPGIGKLAPLPEDDAPTVEAPSIDVKQVAGFDLPSGYDMTPGIAEILEDPKLTEAYEDFEDPDGVVTKGQILVNKTDPITRTFVSGVYRDAKGEQMAIVHIEGSNGVNKVPLEDIKKRIAEDSLTVSA